MDLSEAGKIYQSIRATTLTSLADDVLLAAVRYARIRTDWMLADPGRRAEIDAERTRAHNAFIDSCNILSRNMYKLGENNAWREQIGSDRKTIGDVACHLHCLLGIMAR